MSIRTNQEYKALEKEIFGLKADCSVIEEKILENMLLTDQEKEKIKALEEKAQVIQTQITVRKSEIVQEISSIKDRLVKLRQQQSKLTEKVMPLYLNRYEKIFKRLPGHAVVPVEDKACQGCHMTLTPQVLNNIHNDDLFVICESCSRILYLPVEPSNPD